MSNIDDIIDQTILEHESSLQTFDFLYAVLSEVIETPKQILNNISSCVNFIQNKNTDATLDSLKQISLLIESLNNKIIQSIDLLQSEK